MRKALKMSLLLGTIVVLLTLAACGVDGDYKSNKTPEIRITSWEGVEDEASAAESDSLVFQQLVYWNANDSDGIIKGVAYRVLDENGNPISTPGNSVIDELGEVETISYNGEELTGWVIHYKPGADEDIPLTSDLAKKTIWSQKQYAEINLPANIDGEPAPIISSIEVVCIDDRGAISNIARKSFKAMSAIPSCILSTSRGNPMGKEVGTGLFITFSVSVGDDEFAVAGADYYEYKIGKYVYDPDADTTANAELIEETEWFNTKDTDHPNQVILTKYTTPALTPDFDGIDSDATQLTFTRVTAHVYNYAGVKSNESSIEFAVKEGFHPKTVIYPEKTYALGDNHYVDYMNPEDPENYPYIMKDGPIPVIYATKFHKNMEGQNAVVNSTNLKIYTRWGYYGQFGTPPTSSSGAIVFSNSPYETEVGRVLNEADDKDYFSEIVAFDIRFDDAPYEFFALSQYPENIVTHNDGTQWLRVPKNSVWSISKGLEVRNLANGLHKLEVSAVDLQYEYDPTPAVFEFLVEEFVPKEEREKILVLDATSFDIWSNSQEYADSIYTEALKGFDNVDFVDRDDIVQNTGLSSNANNLSLSDLTKYKTVIYREEHKSSTKLTKDYDALKLYLDYGGNLIISAEKNLQEMNGQLLALNKTMFSTYFDLGLDLNSVISMPQNMPYVLGATPTNSVPELAGLPELDLNLEDSHNNVLTSRQGLYDLSYFPKDTNANVIYKAKIKTVGQDNFSPANEEVYNQFNEVPVAIAKVTPKNKCIAFGFPISFMELDDVIALFNALLSE